jgi:hypothetical protein
MYLRPVDVVSNISGEEFKEKYFDPQLINLKNNKIYFGAFQGFK